MKIFCHLLSYGITMMMMIDIFYSFIILQSLNLAGEASRLSFPSSLRLFRMMIVRVNKRLSSVDFALNFFVYHFSYVCVYIREW